jgi:hypothetical protein
MSSQPRRRAYGRTQARRPGGRAYVMTALQPDAYAAVREVMRRLGTSKSGAVHHMVRIAAGLQTFEII